MHHNMLLAYFLAVINRNGIKVQQNNSEVQIHLPET